MREHFEVVDHFVEVHPTINLKHVTSVVCKVYCNQIYFKNTLASPYD